MKLTHAIDFRDNLNRNMLHRLLYCALPQDQKSLITELVQAGVDLNGQSVGGATPCHEAVFRSAAIIPELVLRGADPNIQDQQGRTVNDVLRMSIEQNGRSTK